MNYESGFGANGSPYEYEVVVAKNAKIVLKRFCQTNDFLLISSQTQLFLKAAPSRRLVWTSTGSFNSLWISFQESEPYHLIGIFVAVRCFP